MRKYMLLGASMLLLAATACNREKEVLPADATVTLRFTAVVSDGSTRTAYQNDKTASWVAGDAISVYVTNGTDGQVVTFTADETLTFEGQAPAGYTTIVAGAYPADAAHTFDATGVKTLHLPASYTLSEDDDPASVLPLAGTYADGVMTFSHPFGALKFTIDNVPATATRFRFTTFGHRINGSYAPNADLEDTVVDAEKSVDINFPAAEGTFAFYVPMPAGELYADSVIALYDEDGKLVFQKVAPAAITVTKNVIKRIAAVSSWTKNEAWQAAYLRDVSTSSGLKSYVSVSGVTGPYDISLSSESYFDTHYGTVEGFLTSSYIPNRQAAEAQPKTGDKTLSYNRLNPGKWIMVIYGLDEGYNFTGEYNVVEIEVPQFTTPGGWALAFNPEYKSNSGAIVPAMNVKTPAGTTWYYANMTKERYSSSYGSDPVCVVWANRTTTAALKTSNNLNILFSSLEHGEYVFVAFGMTEREDEGSDRKPTYEYIVAEYNYDDPTDAFLTWVGQWSVTDASATPYTDTWTITPRSVNRTYSLKGIGGNAGLTCEAVFDEATGGLKIRAQKNFARVVKDGENRDICLYGTDGSHYTQGSYDLMSAAFGEGTTDSATLTSLDMEKYPRYKVYGFVDGQTKYNYGTRYLPSTMTRVITDGVMAPDGWTQTPAEEVEMDPAELVIDQTEVIEAE